MKVKKTASARAKSNKRTGSQAERSVVKRIAEVFELAAFDNKVVKEKDAQIGSSRQFSRNLDGRKIDVWFREDVPSFLRNLAIQVKKKVVPKDHAPIDARVLDEVQTFGNEIPVLISHFRHHSVSGREMAGKTFVTMNIDDFLGLLKQVKNDNK